MAQDNVISNYGKLPPSAIWWGDQMYTYIGLRDDKDAPVNLVPFAEAGQNRQRYRSVFKKERLDPTIDVK